MTRDSGEEARFARVPAIKQRERSVSEGACPDWLGSLSKANPETTPILERSTEFHGQRTSVPGVIARNSNRIEKTDRPTPVAGSYQVLLDFQMVRRRPQTWRHSRPRDPPPSPMAGSNGRSHPNRVNAAAMT
jgi:hypothetical protein